MLEGRPRGLIIFKQISLNLQQTNDFLNLQPVTGGRHECCFFPLAIVFKLKLALKATLKTSMESSRFCKLTTLLIAQVASSWTPPAWNATYECQSQSISTIWVPSLCIVWSQYPPRLCKLLYIIPRLGSIRRGSLQQTWKAREEERTLLARWRSLKCREWQRNRFYTALVTVACGILRGNFAKFSFQKYSRAASGFFVKFLTRVTCDKIWYLGPVPSRGCLPSFTAAQVTRRTPVIDSQRPESLRLAAAPRHSP